ncbi:MAG: hypothetical protein LBI78_04010 [Campylobacteraceae bacterium]|jgi:hypothetical protein|nr:hypothetical protein [Campylobacteraceae bacterium]
MRLSNVIGLITLLFMLSGCSSPAYYEVFERTINTYVGTSFIPNQYEKLREIYSDDKYIYI